MRLELTLPKQWDEIESGQLQGAIARLGESLEQQVGQVAGTDDQGELFSDLFRREDGFFWTLYSKVRTKNGRVSWADGGVRLFLKAPIQRIISLGLLSGDPTKYFDSLLRYFESFVSNAADVESFTLARALWESRAEGTKAAIKDSWIEKATPELRPQIGRRYNEFVKCIDELLRKRFSDIESGANLSVLARERVDLSLPGVIRPIGSHHLLRQVFQDVENIFASIGFSIVEGPEIETPYYNFEALNIPEHHPVRDDMDTFYIELPKGSPGQLLLRTHTSPMQIRTMEKRKPPVRVIVPGKVYRRDNPDATHSFAFHQVEGLAVDTDITFCDFTGTIEYFVQQFFGAGVKTRFRPSYFPFTEPSVEFDVSCIFCGGSGTAASGATCGKCKGAGWIELFGAGMVDPAVYGFVGYDAKKVNGFAFGMGIDRLAMLKYGIEDLQVFFQNDARFLRQFS
jgi:phenylalanyl-tRNA synthetase alpha chain